MNINCPLCAEPTKVPADLLGMKVKCPECGGVFVAAAPSSTAVTKEKPRVGAAEHARRPAEPTRPVPRPARAGISPWLLVGVLAGAVGVLLVIVLVGAVAWWWQRPVDLVVVKVAPEKERGNDPNPPDKKIDGKEPPDKEEILPPPGVEIKQPAALVHAEEPKGPRDANGDPLPAGALARLGSSLFFHGCEHSEGIQGLAYSGDGKWLASGGGRSVRVWNAATGRELLAFDMKQRVGQVVFHPARPGMPPQILIANTLDNAIHFWDLNTGKAMDKAINHPGWLTRFAVSPDGKYVASACDSDKHVYLWHLEDAKEFRRWKPHHGGTRALAFSGDGKFLATGGANKLEQFEPKKPAPEPAKDMNTLALWDVAGGQRVHTFNGHTDSVNSLIWAHNGKVFATVGEDKQGGRGLIFWDAVNGRRISPANRFDQIDPGRHLALSANARTLVTGGVSGVGFYDTRSFLHERGMQTFDGGSQKAFALSPDGATVAAGNERDGRIVIYDVQRRGRKSKVESHTDALTGVVISPDGKTIATSSEDGAARLWDIAGKPIRTIKLDDERGSARINGVAYAPDGKTLALAHQWDGISFWNTDTGQLTKRLEPKDSRGSGLRLNCVAFSPDAKYLAYGGTDVPSPGTILWNLQKNQQAREFEPDTNNGLCVAFSSDGQFIATNNSGVSVWRLETGEKLHTSADGGNTIAFSPAGLLIARENFQHTIVADALNGIELCKFDKSPNDHDAHSLAFSPDGRLLAVADGNDVRIWELTTRRVHVCKGHRGKIKALAFLPDGKALVSASDDCSALVWDMKDVLPPERAAPPAELWTDLKSADRLRAYDAFCRLLGDQEAAIALLQKDLAPAEKADDVLDARRRLWSMKLLEHIATPPARDLLQSLAKSDPNPLLQAQAQGAVKRLAARAKLKN